MLEALEHSLSLPSPLSRLKIEYAGPQSIEFLMKRDDLIDPLICGNKWRKLKYNLEYAVQKGCKTIITFGGPYSNHLIATAAAGAHLKIATVGIIRSYKEHLDNPTIRVLKEKGMKLHFVPPVEYALKEHSEMIQSIIIGNSDPFVLPEGGTNERALRGVVEMMKEVVDQTNDLTHVVLGLGTGGTLAGVSKALSGTNTQIVAISPFKGNITNLPGFAYIEEDLFDKIKIIPCYPQSRFGAFNDTISDYIRTFYEDQNILLDPIYTVKVMMTIEHLLSINFFPEKSKVLVIHTGGLQGVAGYEFQNKCQLI